jgi:hypothetical protein
MKKPLLSMLLLSSFVLGSQIAAENTPIAAQAAYAEIVFVQGGDLLILRSNGQSVNGELIGAKLFTGDQIQTGAKTSVELVTMPRRSRLRLSENTVVTMGNLESDGSTSLNLLYGRLRSKVEKLAGKPAPYKVSSQAFVAGVRGTDFGCDVLVSRPGEAYSTRVYCFEGSVDVGPSAAGAEEAGKAPENTEAALASFAPVLVSAGSMAVIESSSQGSAVDIVEKPIDPDTSAFWKANDFTAIQPSPAPTSTLAPEIPDAGRLLAPAFDFTEIRKGFAAKNSAIIGACAFVTVGAALEAASLFMRKSDAGTADDLSRGGAICVITGLPVLLYSISINPLRGINR